MPSSPLRTFAHLLVLAKLPSLPIAVGAAETERVNGVPVEVLARSTVEAGGRTITYVRIRPPVFPAAPATAPAPEPDAAALAEAERLAATTVFDWQPTITEVDAGDDVHPAGLNLVSGPAEYVVETTAAELAGHEADLAPLDSLLAYHDLHREALLAEQARREALTAELARQAAEARTKPKDTTIYFWKNENPAPAP